MLIVFFNTFTLHIMVNYCAICDEKFVKGSEISFHKFPKQEHRRNLWIHACKPYKNKARVITPSSLICSKHFRKSDFVWNRQAGLRILKNTAIPSIFGKDILNNSSSKICNTPTTLFITQQDLPIQILEPIQSSKLQNVMFTFATCKPDNIHCTDEPAQQILKKDVGTLCKMDPDVRLEICSCIKSLNRSEIQNENEPSDTEFTQDQTQQYTSQKKTTLLQSPRSRDENEEQFFAEKEMDLSSLKAKILKQNKTIKTIHQRNRRLRKKVQGLKSLLEHLRCKGSLI